LELPSDPTLTSNLKPQTSSFKLQASNFKLQTRHQQSIFNHQFYNLGLRFLFSQLTPKDFDIVFGRPRPDSFLISGARDNLGPCPSEWKFFCFFDEVS